MEKRMISLFTFFCLCFTGLMAKVAEINFSAYSIAGTSYGQKTVFVGSTRGKIYDRNLNKLTDTGEKLIAVVTPSVGSSEYLSFMSDMDSFNESIQNGSPFAVEVDEAINNDFIRTFTVPVRYGEGTLAVHLVGYISADGKNGLSGIERAYDALLRKSSGELTVSFEVDAKGRVLAGMDKFVNDSNFNSMAGVALTIDSRIQRITENAVRESCIRSGCAAVMKIDSGEILALSSVPVYNPNNVAASLTEEGSPLVNKALQQYSVGSVFKPLVAAAALESGADSESEYECSGSFILGDKSFACYNSTAHGTVNMQTALEKSCNCYFINLINQIDVDYLLRLCEDIGIGRADEIAQGLTAAAGSLPEREKLKIKGELANFAFGQGELMMTPIQMLKLYHMLATGNAVDVSVIYGVVDSSGKVTAQGDAVPQKLLTDGTVRKLRRMLFSVIENGNAYSAESDIVSLAGKTGTAQSGIYEKGKEIYRTWFAGFFPADNPEYVVVVLNENGVAGNSDCAPVFREICERIVRHG